MPEIPTDGYLDEREPIEIGHHWLPHWRQGEVWTFLTWRLGDSLPLSKLNLWKDQKKCWLEEHPEPWSAGGEQAYHDLFSEKVDGWLDQGMGACILKDKVFAGIMADCLMHYDGERYDLGAFVVMPNHLHILVSMKESYGLSKTIQSWKGFTARKINKMLKKSGPL